MTKSTTDRKLGERAQFETVKRFLDLRREDARALAAFRPVAAAHTDRLVDLLYAHVVAQDAVKHFFQSEQHIESVKAAQTIYFERLFEGKFDEAYHADRVRVGEAHARIGLGPRWYIALYSKYLCLLHDMVLEENDTAEGRALFKSVIKTICLDMGIAIDTYINSQRAREEGQADKFIHALEDFSQSLQVSSANILTTTSEHAASAQQQAAAVAQVTSTLAELRQASAQTLERAEEVLARADHSIERSQVGATAVGDTVDGMREIRAQMHAIAEKILLLSGHSQKIGEIIASVNEIAEQSKLLALNAAIEAARAGEHGKGFAVVATEMRSLADQSKGATAQVRSLLGEIQAATNSAVVATEEGTKKVSQGMSLAERAGHDIQTVAHANQESASAAKLIANAARQLGAGVQQVADAMVSINEGTNHTVAGLRLSEESAASLARVAEAMRGLIIEYAERETDAPEFRLA